MTTAPATTQAYRVTPARVLRSEAHKLRTLRSSWITLGSAAALVLSVGIIMGATYTSDGGDSDVDTVILVLFGSTLGTLCTVVLGILVTAGEYSTGMIRASLTAVPARLPVLWAKAAVFTVTVLTVMVGAALITFAAAQLFLHDTDQAASLSEPAVLGAVLGNAAGDHVPEPDRPRTRRPDPLGAGRDRRLHRGRDGPSGGPEHAPVRRGGNRRPLLPHPGRRRPRLRHPAPRRGARRRSPARPRAVVRGKPRNGSAAPATPRRMTPARPEARMYG